MNEKRDTPLQKLKTPRPVYRIPYIKEACAGKNVLDLDCFDETALFKRDGRGYLFSEISSVAASHLGVDSSEMLPDDGITFSEKERIVKSDIYNLGLLASDLRDIDVVVAGELIEHLPDTLRFFKILRETLPGRRLVCTTPNATGFANIVLSFFSRESAHPDHLHFYSMKTLNTLCGRAGFIEWKIVPYHVQFSEVIFNAQGVKKGLARAAQKGVNLTESLFPMTSGGYILDVQI